MNSLAKPVHTCPSGAKLYLSTAVLLTIGTIDLLATLAWLALGMKEGNPIFKATWEAGPLAFVALKLAFLFGPILILEYARKQAPKSAEQGTWLAVAAYAALWVGHLLSLLHR
jgi:hypothetical protein